MAMLGLFKMAAGRSLKWTADAGVKLAFYEWAYGYLAEPDADIGILGEYMVGLYDGVTLQESHPSSER